MNRTDRLYAIVEELRAISPRLRSARELAARYEVSIRTIERDICALQQAGIPIYADVGRRGGYALDKSMSLPPLNLTPAETVALAVALARHRGGPFERAGRSALRKIVAVLPERDAVAARDLAARIRLLSVDAQQDREIPAVIERAIEVGRVLRIGYLDRFGARTEREVEPFALVNGTNGWYLAAWCRLRGSARCFRLDRIGSAVTTELPAPHRPFDGSAWDIPDSGLRVVAW
ncbi:YafY family transcriptional regulator [Streptomyces gardneri]|uniref:helix-turn-helix transcriptional regulator n=1 Tax=Nocardia TaxID=1817 RepID=UPI0013591ED2|nr:MULTISPECIES: YafY family protein [Nocardia]MBF6166406.1 YafY family transcriptional regulator [Streptomyces gardneri]MBF6205186.1 YafY family transcriptional regulator [Streptomyces gardneri]UAK30983.1 YafY family transcriptional regulator [Nocardia asteroides]